MTVVSEPARDRRSPTSEAAPRREAGAEADTAPQRAGAVAAAGRPRRCGSLGFVVALLLTALTAAFEAFLTSLYWDEYRLPVSVVAAVVVNLALIWFTVVVTGRRLPVAAIAVRVGRGDGDGVEPHDRGRPAC